MTRTFLALLVLASLLHLSTCARAPDYPSEPVITYEGVDKTEIFQFTNGPADSLRVQLSYTDGDGDLGRDSVDIFVFDSRIPTEQISFRIPSFPSSGTGNGISGDIFLSFINTDIGVCCISNGRFCAENPAQPVDTVSYSIQIQDRAGNLSNIVRTEVIEIKCLGN